MLTRRIVIQTQPTLTGCATLAEEAQVIGRYAAILKKRGHAWRELATKSQVQREMLERVLAGGAAFCLLARRMEMLDGFALHEDRIGTLGENRFNGELVRHAHVADRAAERLLIGQCFIPESAQRREARADEYLVDRGVVSDPRITACECARVVGEQNRKCRILKSSQPVRHTEVAKVGD